ncbi:helix-turn-helix transcriptional regulator [Geoglobus acetivorans]|uniref:Methanogenesis regulatory protein FilR1 middle domain-containing protein n=1 Tax=Geoglobus acetivorans TaxID=565033 RepID=A0A0A7GG80_GEOAI|nr:hypothetical protein GACE_2035 [Geoglobus acetivorans]
MMCSEVSRILDFAANDRVLEILEAIEREEISDLKKCYPRSTLHYTIQKLKRANLIERRIHRYELTQLGITYLKMIRKFHRCLDRFHNLMDKFPDHRIELPEDFVLRLDELGEFDVVESQNTDVLRPHRIVLGQILRSKEVRGIVPILYPDYPTVFREVVSKVDLLEIIVTEDVWKLVEKYDHVEEHTGKFRVYLADKHPCISLIVTDTFFSAGFYRRSGDFDFWRLLISNDKSATRFGRDLFEHYRRISQRVL